MGCVSTIKYNAYPDQCATVGNRVKVCFHYDAEHCIYGKIIRNDEEEPFETIIQLDDGRIVRATECQWHYC